MANFTGGLRVSPTAPTIQYTAARANATRGLMLFRINNQRWG